MIKEELEELFGAIEDKNMTEVRDAVADVNVTNLGVPYLAGFDVENNVLAGFNSKGKSRVDIYPENEVGELKLRGADAFWNNLKEQADLVQLNLNKLYEAIENKNIDYVWKYVEEINVHNLGVAYLGGFDADKDMLSVFESNLSKVSKTLEDAQKTKEFYAKKGVDVYIEECQTMPGYIVKVSEEVIGNDGKKYPKNKFLKCVVGFKDPKFD